jgi:hypothetical protein
MRSPRRAWIALDTPSPDPARVAAEGPGRPPLLAPSGDGGGAGEMWKPWGQDGNGPARTWPWTWPFGLEANFKGHGPTHFEKNMRPR